MWKIINRYKNIYIKVGSLQGMSSMKPMGCFDRFFDFCLFDWSGKNKTLKLKFNIHYHILFISHSIFLIRIMQSSDLSNTFMLYSYWIYPKQRMSIHH
jgi:NADH:ubiquinone oxidoreductase subunit C